jgi:uncharacterized protein
VRALEMLAKHPVDAARVLKLGPKGAGEIARNRAVRTSGVLPAIERYTGVLYDGIGVQTLEPDARAWIDGHVVVGSALFGLLRAADSIPAYRLSSSSAMPGLPLRAHWTTPVSRALAGTGEWLLDARSAGYAALGPAPVGSATLFVEELGAGGARRALNHWNKHAKGELVRTLARSGPDIGSRDDLLTWASGSGIRLEPRGASDVTLLVEPGASTSAG